MTKLSSRTGRTVNTRWAAREHNQRTLELGREARNICQAIPTCAKAKNG